MDEGYVTTIEVTGRAYPTPEERRTLEPLNNLQQTLQNMPAHIIDFRWNYQT